MDPDISNNRIPSGHRETRDLDLDLITGSINSRICANFSNETKDSKGTLSCFFFLYVDSNSLK